MANPAYAPLPNLCPAIEAMQPAILERYHALHRIPEVGLSLPRTVAYVTAQLDALSIPYEVLPEASGIVATLGSGSGPVIGIRADMDALAVKEDSGLPFAAEGCDAMHACGHDAHTAMLLTAAEYLKPMEDKLPGKLVLLFQTAEEPLKGALHMIEQGVLERYPLDFLLALHAGSFCGPAFASGDIVLSRKLTFFSSDSIRITVRGKGGHAASPHNSVDPILTAAHILEALQQVAAREVSPHIPKVISITHLHAGAPTYNVIPDEALLMGGIRTTDPETRAFLVKRAEEVCRQTAAAMRANVDFEIVEGCPALANDPVVADRVFDSVSELFPGRVHWMPEANTCSEDCSYFFERVPGCYLFLASMGLHPDDGQLYPHHNARFRLDETVLWRGAAAIIRSAWDLMHEA